jgi:hypothetical protein
MKGGAPDSQGQEFQSSVGVRQSGDNPFSEMQIEESVIVTSLWSGIARRLSPVRKLLLDSIASSGGVGLVWFTDPIRLRWTCGPYFFPGSQGKLNDGFG